MVDLDERLKEMRELAAEARKRRPAKAALGALMYLLLMALLVLFARNSCSEARSWERTAVAMESIERKLVTGR